MFIVGKNLSVTIKASHKEPVLLPKKRDPQTPQSISVSSQGQPNMIILAP